MANAILFYDGKDFCYPEDLVPAGELGAAQGFCTRIFTVLSSFRYLGYREIIEIGFDFDNYVVFVHGAQGFYARYQFSKDIYPYVTDTARYFVFQVVLPQLISLS